MKKIIVFLMCLCFVIPTMAEQVELPCNGGLIITANNGTKFCRSNKTMNWWSAFAWCESQGLKLAEFKTMCPGVSQTSSNTDGDCPNLQGLGGDVWVWSSLAYFSHTALMVHLSSSAVFGFYGRNDGNRYALCE